MREIDLLIWPDRNQQRRVFYDSDTQETGATRSVTYVQEAIDPDQPVLSIGNTPPSQRTYQPGEVIDVFCEGTDGVTLTAQSLAPYAAYSVDTTDAACAAPAPGTCDLTAVVASKGTDFVRLTITTSHPPFAVSTDAGPYETNKSDFYGLEPERNYSFRIRDANNCVVTLQVVTERLEDAPIPAGIRVDSFQDAGETIGLYYQATPTRKIVAYSPSGRTLGPVDEATRGRLEGQIFNSSTGTICEDATEIVFSARLEPPFASVRTIANSTACGYTPPDGGGGDPDPDPTTGSIAVLTAPLPWSPVHLPVLLTLQILPGTDGITRDVLLYLDASDDNGTTWQSCGAMRRAAGSNKLVQFNLSELLKSTFTITPPDLGEDTALWRTWRARVGYAGLFTGGTTGELLQATGRVVNGAAPNGGSGAYLSDRIPLPVGYPYLLSKIATSSVRNETANPNLAAAECPPYPVRLVWLNQRGGWSSHVWGGKHELGTTTEGATIWTTQTGARRYASRGTVRPVVNLYSDRLTPSVAALVRSVRESIQVYHLLSSGEYVPVVVDEGSYRDYRHGDKTHTVDFTITYPAKAVQTQ